MEITRDKSVGKLFLSQQAYVEKVLKHFNMNNAKPMTVPFATHFKLSIDMSPKTDEKIEHISSVPYSSVIASCMLWFAPNLTFHMQLVLAKMSDSVIGYGLDFAGDLDMRRSLTGYFFSLSGSAIS
ncbi:hypothetical protein GH714_011739 [Hevea brasiliensis]|uniref:Reverse transcriptase Ty1/copia-type domain-containing protein n=1 Tax=Hevea brasiliensis TaxID=3981 RepID=A0A6A6LR06_HEVBR|nr:hypothetical protein GH714_011739 [Hevea brasiliensis]